MSFIAELKRRNVFRVGVAYAIVGWLLVEVASTVLPTFAAPEWVMKVVTFLVVLGFPLALILAWAFELTPEGLKREETVDRAESIRHHTGRKLDFAIIGLLAIAVVYFAVDKFVLEAEPDLTEEPVAREKSIAVLPFDNISPDPEDAYFADGIHDEVLAQISKIRDLKVISRTSVMSYRGKDRPSSPKIAAALGVANLLEGSVRLAGDRVRITVQLIEAESDAHLWTEAYDRELTAANIFSIQSDIAEQIAGALEATLTPAEREEIEPTEDLEAYNLYLLGRFQWNKFTEESVAKARAYYEQAIARDPSYARAYAGLADVYLVLGGAGWTVMTPKEAIPRAKSAAQRAIALDPNLGEAHGSLGLVYTWYEWSWADAERQLKHGIEVDPNSALAHADYAHYLTAVGRHEQAIQEIGRALELDPISSLMYENAAWHFYNAHRFDEALDYCQRALELNPDYGGADRTAALVYLQQDSYEAAISIFASSSVSSSASPLGYAYGRAGKTAEAMQLLREVEVRRKGDLASAADLALIHLGLGEHAEALRYLETALEETSLAGSLWLSYLKVEPIWDPLRVDPRFADLLRRMNFPEN